VGLDISETELALAPAGAYDEKVVADISQHSPELDDRFDVIVSWQVFEHVESLRPAVANLRRYLRPGGRLVAMLSGRFAAFAVAGRLLPNTVGSRVASRILRVKEDDVFPTRYDQCYSSALERLFADWSSLKLEPQYRGAVYFRGLGPLLPAYVTYESWAERASKANLATHYIVQAKR
jgi:SAM-dependent methyltransferase